MRTHDPITRMLALMVPLSLITMLAIQCSNNGPASSSDGGAGTLDSPGTTGNSNDAMNVGSANGRLNTTAEERMSAATELRALRASMVAELEVTRARLNQGTGTNPYPGRANDDEHASELAHGLERVDRALAALDAATDETWVSDRAVQLKEVEEARAWWKKYEKDHVAMKK